MTAPSRSSEFAAGTGKSVLVDRTKSGQHYVHVDAACEKVARTRIGVFANERTARAAVAGLKACKHCRNTN